MKEIKVIKFIKANLGECCAELREYRKTNILPVGKIWEAMGIAEESVIASILVLVEKIAVESLAEDYEHLEIRNNGIYLEYPRIKIPNISVSILNDTVIILFKKHDSLLSFSIAEDVDAEELSDIVNQELGNLDWDKDFHYVFHHHVYRKAIMEVANKLFKD